MSATTRGGSSIRTATAVLAGTGLGVAAAVGGIAVAQGGAATPATTPATRDLPLDQAGRGQQQDGTDHLPGIPAQDGWSQTRQGQSQQSQGRQGQLLPGQGPAAGHSHGS
ncbi:hypothetical protein [Arsenicicoccus dermatophilus]|uniref:hypothetical protein n=1 Tax=Arsenicicoccus dermatophilus TaxID=1076331 RepID=UPI001F4C5585|nr:hypothetical protein [Arsenicicoccus dermatophilus]MCH8611666.1 hypothetical protein [Arsenicicoccus dermatophilus]